MDEEKKREPSFDDGNHVDVKNEFITADYPEGMKAADLKMLRFVISQCKLGDTEFFEYEFSAAKIADYMNMDKFNLYREAMDMTEKRLFNCNLRIGTEKDHELIHLFRKCTYKNGTFTMRMDEEAAQLFLKLGGQFTEIPIAPILVMKNKNSIRIYELMCQKMMHNYPHSTHATGIEISLDELRKVTETTGKKSYDHAGHFKERVLTPALQEIEKAAMWKTIVNDKKRSRRIVGFSLEVWTSTGYEKVQRYKNAGQFLPEDEIDGQMELSDFML